MHYIINKKGRYGIINPVPENKLSQMLDIKLSYKRDGAEFMEPMWANVKLYNRKKGRFPWGLKNLVESIFYSWRDYYLEQKLEPDTFDIIEENKLDYNENFTNLDNDLRPYQIDAIKALCNNNGGIIACPTGGGKTKIAINFLKLCRFKQALVIVPTKDLVSQWNKQINNNVNACTYQYLTRHKEMLQNYEIVIFDEVHHVASKTLYQIAMLCYNAFLIGLSATPYRNYEPETLKIRAALGKIVYKISIDELIKQGYLVKPIIKIINLPKSPKAMPWDKYQDIYKQEIVKNAIRNKLIIDIALQESKKGITLILCEQIEHGQNLLNILKLEEKIIFVNGGSKQRKQIFEDINFGKYNLVIATKIYGEGIDLPRLNSLILASGGKSSIKVIQNAGRLLRLFKGKSNVVIYDFVDNAKYLGEHFERRLEIYKKNNFEVAYDRAKKQDSL